MSYKNIERSREARLWIVTVIGAATFLMPILSDATVQGHIKDRKNRIVRAFKKKFQR